MPNVEKDAVLAVLRQHWPESGGQSGHQQALAAQAACADAIMRVIPPTECVCPDDICLGTDSDSGMRVECSACLVLDPELPCLRDLPPGGPDAR